MIPNHKKFWSVSGFLFSGLFFLLHTSSSAQIILRNAVSKKDILIGEICVYTVTLEYPESIKWISDIHTDFHSLEVIRIQDYPVEKKNGRISRKTDYLLTAFTLDSFLVPAPMVHYWNGNDTLKAEGKSLLIRVQSILDSNAKDIRPEKPLIEGQIQWTGLILTLIVASVLLLLIGIWIWRRIHNYFIQRRQMAMKIPAVIHTPKELALEALYRLRRERLPEKGEFKRYHTDIANILREYIEQQFHIPAMELPTSELMQAIRYRPELSPEWIQTLHEFLAICDKVKFAKFPSSVEICRVLDQQAEQLIFALGTEVCSTEKNTVEVL